jgi:hypothetical protein
MVEQEDASSPLPFNRALQYAIMEVQANQGSLCMNGTHQSLVYVGDVNLLVGNKNKIKRNKEVISVTCKEAGLEVNRQQR